MSDEVLIDGLEVRFRVGVPDAERERPQRLTLNVVMELDVSAAARQDDLRKTVDYFAVSRRLLALGDEGRSWRLIETLASDIASLVLREFGVAAVTVEVRKYILPEARHVAVRVRRQAQDLGGMQ